MNTLVDFTIIGLEDMQVTLFTNKEWLESEDFPFCITLYPFYSGESLKPHSHEFIEFIYIAGGKGQHEYRGRSYPIASGDVFIIEPAVEHAYQSDKEHKLLVYNVLLQPALLAAELETLFTVNSFVEFFYIEPFLRKNVDFQTHLSLDQHEQAEMIQRLDRLIREFHNKTSGYRIVIKTVLLEMLIFLSRCYDRSSHTSMAALSSTEEIIQQICTYIQQHHSQPLTLAQVSRLCGMSQSAFSAKFKHHVGRTFIEYRNQIRIDTAAGLLLETKHKVTSIAQEVGFDDISFFNALFKQTKGLSPTQYRKQMEGVHPNISNP